MGKITDETIKSFASISCIPGRRLSLSASRGTTSGSEESRALSNHQASGGTGMAEIGGAAEQDPRPKLLGSGKSHHSQIRSPHGQWRYRRSRRGSADLSAEFLVWQIRLLGHALECTPQCS